jgi:hypothetical protein
LILSIHYGKRSHKSNDGNQESGDRSHQPGGKLFRYALSAMHFAFLTFSLAPFFLCAMLVLASSTSFLHYKSLVIVRLKTQSELEFYYEHHSLRWKPSQK